MSEFSQFKDILTSRVRDGKMPIAEQTKKKPVFWIETTLGGSGWFAVMLWDGCGFTEPWESGDGRYPTRELAAREGRGWAAEEDIEFREPTP